MMDHDTSILFNSFHCLRLNESIRDKITNVITQAKTTELLYVLFYLCSWVNSISYALLVAKHQVVTLVCPKKYFLHPSGNVDIFAVDLPSDIHLILNFVNSSTSLRTAESWAPLCLPKFNDQGKNGMCSEISGFLHAHVSFLAQDLCLLLMSTKQNSFYELNTCKNMIQQVNSLY